MSTATAMPTIGEAVTMASRRLTAAGIAEARREARLLVALALQEDLGVVVGYPERPLSGEMQARLTAVLDRRAAREPLSRIAGRREFWSLDFALSPDTLDPRPDSETLIAAALELAPGRKAPLRLLDFGTGTGCLLLALLAELPNATGIGVDILAGAVQIARRNAAALDLGHRTAFIVGRWGEAIVGRADVILANPPYIPSAEIDRLAPEVSRYDPRRALDGGPDGIQAYRELASETCRLLAPDGLALFEVGEGQAASVAALMVESGLRLRAIKRDLAGIERCVAVTLAQTSVPPLGK